MKIAILTILLLLWGCAEKKAPLAGQAVDPNVLFEHSTFPDSALERIVREMLDRPRGPLSAAELGSVETLDASHRGIAELTGIGKLQNLRLLWLGANKFTEIRWNNQFKTCYCINFNAGICFNAGVSKCVF